MTSTVSWARACRGFLLTKSSVWLLRCIVNSSPGIRVTNASFAHIIVHITLACDVANERKPRREHCHDSAINSARHPIGQDRKHSLVHLVLGYGCRLHHVRPLLGHFLA